LPVSVCAKAVAPEASAKRAAKTAWRRERRCSTEEVYRREGMKGVWVM
jgi:hypothetical protein